MISHNPSHAYFSTVPGAIQDLKVRQSADVYAEWDDVVTTPPIGVVSRYLIEYRDANKGDIVQVIHSSKFSFLVVLNVMNANAYEVGVKVHKQEGLGSKCKGQRSNCYIDVGSCAFRGHSAARSSGV